MRGASLNNKVEIRKLSFSYNSNKDEQLKDINLDIKDGECCVIIGAVSYTHLTLPTNREV